MLDLNKIIKSMEEAILPVIEPAMHDLGFAVVDIRIRKNPILKNKTLSKSFIIDVILERQDEQGFSLSDCGLASRHISVLLDSMDMISGQYYLHVASAGIERPLMKLADYQRFVGRDAKITLKKALNNIKEYKGQITDIVENDILLNTEKNKVSIGFNSIKKAHLLMTDEIFRKMVNKNQTK